jgi:Undecaprenyl-phosphate galactose phosphotransferase WbaP
MPSLSRNELLRLLDRYGQCFGHVMVIPDLIGMSSIGIRVREMRGIIGLEVTRQLLRPSAKIAKRLLDLATAAILVPVTAPLILAFALLIKLESPGPILYANERIGLGGRKFKAWKLRTMVVTGDQVLREYFEKHPLEQFSFLRNQKLRNDPRITKIGRILRKTSIDELPQLWNVFKGEMSVVGPRPFLENQIEMYGRSFELYKLVRPGITGLWQVSGRNKLPFSERVLLDAYCIQNWSVWMDIYILARTFGVVLTGRGAY